MFRRGRGSITTEDPGGATEDTSAVGTQPSECTSPRGPRGAQAVRGAIPGPTPNERQVQSLRPDPRRRPGPLTPRSRWDVTPLSSASGTGPGRHPAPTTRTDDQTGVGQAANSSLIPPPRPARATATEAGAIGAVRKRRTCGDSIGGRSGSRRSAIRRAGRVGHALASSWSPTTDTRIVRSACWGRRRGECGS